VTRPRFKAPELATLTKEIFDDPNWIFEEKFDGIRALAIQSGGKLSLLSRNQKRLDASFQEVVKALTGKTKKDFVVDGELVAFDGKVTSFTKLQNRSREKKTLFFYVFDLLHWDGQDYTKLPLLERKKVLKAKFPFSHKVRYTPHVKSKGKLYFKKAAAKGLEGVMGKRADSLYRSRRTTDWRKFKCSKGQELVIGGYTEPQGARKGFGALLVGYYEKGAFHYAGKVGTGYSEATLRSLGKKLTSLERASSPFVEEVREKKLHYVRPSLVCEVGFTEWTKGGKLRHPRFLGLRKDKPAKKVTRERGK